MCIVTGAGARAEGIGTGRAASILFAREGARVLLVDRSEDAARMTAEMIAAEGGQGEIFVGDMTRADDIRAMVEQAVARLGRVDVLQNNLGVHGPGTILEVTEEQWAGVMQVNVTAMMLVSREVLPVMLERGSGAITQPRVDSGAPATRADALLDVEGCRHRV